MAQNNEARVWILVQNGKKISNQPMTLSEATSQRDRMVQALQESGQAAPTIEIKQLING